MTAHDRYDAAEQRDSSKEEASQRERLEAATFKLVCSGRDGKLILFEDADGHFTAVRASRLA